MSGAFAGLEDRLLKGGIAPRHVKRYLRELTEHLTDLAEAQRANGLGETEAAANAKAALGPDEELADAMLKQRDFRSLAARFPWAVFLLATPFALVLGYLLWGLAMIAVGFAGGVLPAHHKIPIPAWYTMTGSILMFVANCVVAPALGAALAWIALRQRMRPAWPLLGMALILFIGLHCDFNATGKNISIGLGPNGLITMLPFYPDKGPFGPRGTMHWALLFEQAALLTLPIAWLLWARRNTATPR